MMDRHMASALDRWLTTPPWDGDPEYPTPPHCTSCGGFLPMTPSRTEPKEDIEHCDGGENDWGLTLCGREGPHEVHDEVMGAWTIEYRTCRKCGHENKWVEA
jgi:hypothetical protein